MSSTDSNNEKSKLWVASDTRNPRDPSPKTQSEESKGGPKADAGIIREAIFGINDGLVATVGLVSGESLSHQPHSSIVIAGLSAVGAAMVSMAVGSYVATSSQNDFTRKQMADEESEITDHPDQEKREVRRLLRQIGVPRKELPAVARNVVASRPRWLRFMLREELGIHEDKMEPPVRNAIVMGIAVLIGSAPPMLPYLFSLSVLGARYWSWGLSLATALVIGATKGRLTGSSLIRSALSFAVLAGLSAAVGAMIGLGLGAVGA